jgi:predicted lipid-binding transport protein (Tim44 family)
MQADPAVTAATIAARLEYVYRLLNDAWSKNDLTSARPVLSDGLADYLQYWINAYESSKLRNALEDMRLTRHELVKLARDRYYDALTIRIFATGKDYVVRTDRSDGAIVRGSKDTDREYSEYWTLVRSSTRRGAPRVDARCGSCGAALTVNMAGECEHCGSHVTAGEFDWVLSKIEQDEAY